VCPYCIRHFRSKGGRTKHIRARHPEEGSDAHGPNMSVPPSPMQPLPQSHSQPSSPIPSDMIPPPSPLQSLSQSPSQPLSPFPPDTVPPHSPRGPYSAGPDTENPFSDLGHVPAGFYSDIGDEMNREPSPGGGVSDGNGDVPDPPRITCIYHCKLDGKSKLFLNTYQH
jgi:hypothetical protein